MPDDSESFRLIEERFEIRPTRGEQIIHWVTLILAVITLGLITFFLAGDKSAQKTPPTKVIHERYVPIPDLPPPPPRFPLEPLTAPNPPVALPSKTLLEEVCSRYELSPELVRNLIWRESSGFPGSLSHSGARGLMQITKPTWNEVCEKLEKTWSFDLAYVPRYNLEVGCYYLRWLIDRAKIDGSSNPIRDALMGYNCGRRKVLRNEIPESSQRFATSILSGFKESKMLSAEGTQ